MRLKCPICGERDSREFTYMGHASMLERPAPDAGDVVWDDYLHNRENIAGVVEELWQHTEGCGAWLVVQRDTRTHEVLGVKLAREVARAG
ncbi:MAG: sarcosine oxidase subunit delta [Rhodobacteraceae bacterium]|nr:sarcosine oxidase subunit delta [Paracoccaceae bacterium]